MALQSSGAISLANIQSEFGGSNPISLSEYYRNGGLVTSNNTNVPTSGTISLSNFYGASAEILLTSGGTINGQAQRQQITASSFVSSGGVLRIPSNLWIWSDSTSVAALTIDIPCTIINEGKIIGKGGDGGNATNGNGLAGGPAIKVNSGVSGVYITNSSGAYIAGGGGGGGASPNYAASSRAGGGGGAGGGRGGDGVKSNDGSGTVTPTPTAGGAGGSIGSAGSSGAFGFSGGNNNGGGFGGGAGGGGANSEAHPSPSYTGSGGGGGGGRVLPGTGGAATTGSYTTGAGGSGGNAGGSGHAGGGGGWGAAGGTGNGGAGGSGGAAISGSASLTNNGTIYGST